jgi:hypothetical protein
MAASNITHRSLMPQGWAMQLTSPPAARMRREDHGRP